MTKHLTKPIRAIHFRANLAGLCPIVLAFLMTVGSQGSAKGVGREASIDILSKGQILVTNVANRTAEYHVIYKGEFYYCKSWDDNAEYRANLRCVDNNPKDE